ncbi:hypothetical protein J3F84DRAFT_283560 [Trichoderma pleuroticola]
MLGVHSNTQQASIGPSVSLCNAIFRYQASISRSDSPLPPEQYSPPAATTEPLHRLIAVSLCKLPAIGRDTPRCSTMLHDAPRFGNQRPKPFSRTGC